MAKKSVAQKESATPTSTATTTGTSIATAAAAVAPSNASEADGVVEAGEDGGFLSELDVEMGGPGAGRGTKGGGAAAPIDPHTGLPVDAVGQQAADGASGAGGRLPHLDRIQEAFGEYDVSGVRAHNDAEAASGIGANAYSVGADVVFAGAPSLETAAEEATHSVLQGAGKGPDGVGQEGDVYEKHADSVAKRVSEGGSAVELLDAMTGGDRSVKPGAVHGVQREAAAAPAAALEEAATEVEGPAPPASVELVTPGGRVVVDVPSNTEAGGNVTVTRPDTPIAGVSFESVTVALDEQFNPNGGQATVSVDRGIVSGRGTLDVVGNRVVGDVDVDIDSPLGRGTGTASMTEAGIESRGSIAANEVRLSNGLAATQGSASWRDGADGLSIDGRVAGVVPEFGDFNVDLAFSEGQVGGEVGVELAERQLLGDAKVTGGSLRGTYGDEGITVGGPMGFAVGDWATGSSDGTLDLGARTLDGTAAATVADVSRGDLTLHSGSVQVGVAANTFEGGEASFDLSAKGFRGGLEDGRYDPSTDRIDGNVNAAWEGEAEQLGGLSMKSAAGQLAVEGNIPTALSNASAHVGITVGGEADKVDASIESLDYDLAAGSVSGQARGTTATPIEVADGAVSLGFTDATADVQANAVTEVSGAASVEAGQTEQGRLLGITGQGSVDVAGGNVNEASGTASLLQSPVTLVPGFDIVSATGTAAVQSNELQAAGVDAGWRSPTFEGSVEGAFDSENVQVDGEVSASVHTETNLGPATLSSGSGMLTVEANAPKAFEGSAAGKLGEDFEFDAPTIDVDVEGQKLGGTATVGVQEGQTVDVASVGTIEQMNASGEVVDNELQSVEGEVAGAFAPGATPFLDFELDGRYRATDSVVESAAGSLSLADGETRELGPITLDRFAASASVTENAPQLESASVGFFTDSFRGGIENAELDMDRETVSGEASAELTAPKTLGGLEITSASGTAEVTDNALGTLQGDVEGKFATGDNEVSFSAVGVDYDMENENLSGEVTASTSDFMELLPNRLKAQITSATGEVADNQLTSVSGDYDVRVSNEGEESLQIGANGELDVEGRNIVDATGEAELLQPFELFGGALGVTDFIAAGSVQNNELQSGQVTAVAEIQAGVGESTETPRLQIDGSFAENDGSFDFDGTAGMEEMQIIRPTDEGRQLSASMSGTIDTAANDFAVDGGAEYRINENFGGSLDAEMDQEFDPGISGSLDGRADLVEETTLFAMQKTVVYAPIPPIFGASLDAELSMSVGQLSVAPEIAIQEAWHPISGATDLPDFDTTTQAQWGVHLEGGLVPYLYGGIRSPVITAAIGAMGGASLSADAAVNADVGFTGQNGEFAGEVGLGVDVGASLDLSAGVFAQLGVLGWDAVDWRKDDLVDYTLADLFSMQWGKTFTFGDRGPEESEGAAGAAQQLTATEDSAGEAAAPSPETSRPRLDGTPELDDASVEGGPEITGASAFSALSSDEQSASGDEGEMGALETAMNALTAMKDLYDSVGGAVEQLADFPMGTFQLIWDIVCGRFDFDGILEDARAVYDSLDALMDFVGPMLSGWFESFWDFIKEGPPNLLKAFWGDSGAFREIISDGETIQNAPAEMLVALLEGALWDDMWTSGADESASMELLQVAASRGLIGHILTVERTRAIFEELDHTSAAFRAIVVQHAPASVIRSELGRYVGHWRLSGDEENKAMSFIRAANTRGMLTSVLSQDDAEDILSGMDGSNYGEMERILSSNGYDV